MWLRVDPLYGISWAKRLPDLLILLLGREGCHWPGSRHIRVNDHTARRPRALPVVTRGVRVTAAHQVATAAVAAQRHRILVDGRLMVMLWLPLWTAHLLVWFDLDRELLLRRRRWPSSVPLEDVWVGVLLGSPVRD